MTCWQILAALQREVGAADIHPGQAPLAAALGVSQKTVSLYLRTFEDVGLLVCTDPRFHSGGKSKAYRVRLGDAAGLSA